MTILESLAIDTAKVKTRWEEPYVSEAINSIASATPRGVYRGFVVEEKAVPAKGVTIKVDPGAVYSDSMLMHEDIADGFKTRVRYTANFDLDVPYTTDPVNPQTFYVWVDVDYSISSATQAFVRVGDSGDRLASSVTLAKIVVPATVTTILDAHITQDVTNDDTITTPYPTSDLVNIYGMVTNSELTAIPTQAERDALDAAESPSSSNRFITDSDLVDHSSHPKTYTVSDGTLSTGGDYEGANAIESALTALEAGSGGHIYVRKGNYTLATSKTITKPIRIRCETGPNPSAGTGVKLTASVAGSDLKFRSYTDIHGLYFDFSASTLGLEFEDYVTLSDVRVDGLLTINTLGAGGTPYQSTISGLHVDGQMVMDNSIQVAFTSCYFTPSTVSTYAVDISGTVSQISFTSCFFSGTGGGVNGGGLRATNDTGMTLRSCRFDAGGSVNAIYFASTTAEHNVIMEGSYIFLSSALTNDAVEIVAGPNSNFIIDGMRIQVFGAYNLTDPLLTLHPKTEAKIDVRGLYLEGDADVYPEISSSNVGVVTVTTDSGDTNPMVSLEMMIRGYPGSLTNLTNGGIVVVDSVATNARTEMSVKGVDWAADASANYLAAIRVNVLSNGGEVVIRDSYLEGIANQGGGARTWYGVYLDGTGDSTSMVTIKDSLIANFDDQDIETEDSVGPNIRVIGCRGYGRSGLGALASARWRFYTAVGLIITNNFYDHRGSDEANQTFMHIRNGTGHVKGTIANNLILMDTDTADRNALDIDTLGGPMVIVGNSGLGQIDVTNTDNHIGIGDGDYNVNALTVVLV